MQQARGRSVLPRREDSNLLRYDRSYKTPQRLGRSSNKVLGSFWWDRRKDCPVGTRSLGRSREYPLETQVQRSIAGAEWHLFCFRR